MIRFLLCGVALIPFAVRSTQQQQLTHWRGQHLMPSHKPSHHCLIILASCIPPSQHQLTTKKNPSACHRAAALVDRMCRHVIMDMPSTAKDGHVASMQRMEGAGWHTLRQLGPQVDGALAVRNAAADAAQWTERVQHCLPVEETFRVKRNRARQFISTTSNSSFHPASTMRADSRDCVDRTCCPVAGPPCRSPRPGPPARPSVPAAALPVKETRSDVHLVGKCSRIDCWSGSSLATRVCLQGATDGMSQTPSLSK